MVFSCVVFGVVLGWPASFIVLMRVVCVRLCVCGYYVLFMSLLCLGFA